MAKMSQEAWIEKYVKRQDKIDALKKELDTLKKVKVDKNVMNAEFRDAFGLPVDFRVVKGRVQQRKKVVKPPSNK